ncbi:TetR family transcriptional regulator, partial [Parabacteroides sp. AM18-12LB]
TKDYNTVPLKEIEKSLNLSRGCMSYHYPSKQELFIDKRLQHGSPEGDRKKSEFIKRMYVISLSKQARTVY